LKIPLLVTNHVYASIGGYFPTNVQSGGCMIPGTLIQTSNGLVKIEDIKVGDFVLTMDGEKEVTHTWTFDDSENSNGSMKKTWEIEFEDGVTYQVSEDHRFLVNENWKDESSWKKVWELSEDDEVIMVKSNV
jgi:intein/homing endonuclease